jgi:hypothetical protein
LSSIAVKKHQDDATTRLRGDAGDAPLLAERIRAEWVMETAGL